MTPDISVAKTNDETSQGGNNSATYCKEELWKRLFRKSYFEILWNFLFLSEALIFQASHNDSHYKWIPDRAKH
jgi:hypothetical protein